MALIQLFINNFRNLEKVELQPLIQGFNFLYGHNGSGKTSLLEAIYYLGHRRSFRSLNATRLIRYSADQFTIFSQLHDSVGQIVPLGMERLQAGEFRVRVNGENVATQAELAAVLPMRLINVHSHYLLEGSPGFRRKYLDWGIFYQNQAFQACWLRFNRLLKQRNAALRRQASLAELASWSQEWVEAALLFHHSRVAYLEQLLPVLRSILSQGLAAFFDLSELTIDYQPGWDVTQPYPELLAATLPKDREHGYTQWGPQRADLQFKIKQIPAKEILSTGQQKLLVCGMILAQGALLAQGVPQPPIYLVDDLPAELDGSGRSWLINTLAEQRAQIFVTAVEPEAMRNILARVDTPVKMFHVKQGTITEQNSALQGNNGST